MNDIKMYSKQKQNTWQTMFCSLKYGMSTYIQGCSSQKRLTSEGNYDLQIIFRYVLNIKKIMQTFAFSSQTFKLKLYLRNNNPNSKNTQHFQRLKYLYIFLVHLQVYTYNFAVQILATKSIISQFCST